MIVKQVFAKMHAISLLGISKALLLSLLIIIVAKVPVEICNSLWLIYWLQHLAYDYLGKMPSKRMSIDI